MKSEIIVDFKKIIYCKYILPYASTSIVIIHGLTESKEKYKDVVKAFLSKGFNVYILDLPGHGESDGHLQDKKLYHIDRFDDYVFTVKRFINDVVKRDSQNKIVLYSHSMGGLISALLLEENQNLVNALILSSPMFGLKMKMPLCLQNLILDFMNKINPKKIVNGIEKGKSGPTWKWLYEVNQAYKKVLIKENAEKINVPILLLLADKDLKVDNSASEKFSAYFKNIKKFVYPEAIHAIYMSNDKVKNEYYDDIFRFLRFNGL